MRKALLTTAGVGLILSACATALPAAAQEPEAPRCTLNIAAMADALEAVFGEKPLVGAYKGQSETKIGWVLTVFYNADTGSWTVTQSDAGGTCVVTGATASGGGVTFDMDAVIDLSRRLNAPGTES